MDSALFISSLQKGDAAGVRRSAKADLHNHGILGGRFEEIEKREGGAVQRPPSKFESVPQMSEWVRRNIGDYRNTVKGLEFLFEAAFRQAANDGVTVLEMSVESSIAEIFPGGAAQVVEIVKTAHKKNAPQINFKPEIGLKRQLEPERLYRWLNEFLQTGYFKSIDLYADELSRDIAEFAKIYRHAKSAGLKLKAHVGEFGTAADVVRAVETLELDAVQHGIAAADELHAMRFLAESGVQLNICPTSNVVMGRVESIRKHPIRKLFDEGVTVTVNADDVLIFDRGVSEEFMTLFKEGLFSAEELDVIRKTGLK